MLVRLAWEDSEAKLCVAWHSAPSSTPASTIPFVHLPLRYKRPLTFEFETPFVAEFLINCLQCATR